MKIFFILVIFLLFSCAKPTPLQDIVHKKPKVCCPNTQLVGWDSFESLSDLDRLALKTALTGCRRIFKNNNYCLTTFTKSGSNSYRAICGGVRECK